MRSETGRPSDAVKSARVERLRAGNLSSDAYVSRVMETKILTGGRKPSPFLHKKILTHFRVERMHDRTAIREDGGRLRAYKMYAPRPVGQATR
jgi:hypothetical protein